MALLRWLNCARQSEVQLTQKGYLLHHNLLAPTRLILSPLTVTQVPSLTHTLLLGEMLEYVATWITRDYQKSQRIQGESLKTLKKQA